MSKRLRDRLNVGKTTRLAIAINAIQIAAMGGIFLYIFFNQITFLSRSAELALLAMCLVVVVWGAVIDIRDAMTTRKIAEQTEMIEEAYSQLEALNVVLRTQRHDFMNHLQVVFSLTEMQEYAEAMQYIERVYDDIQRIGSMLKTSIPAVNALISAKQADCLEHGIALEADISSSWSNLPVSGWEMCRVLGNLIDNARDALIEHSASDARRICIALSETPGAFTFSVTNNGPRIPEKLLPSIFQMGFTTKSEGHGSGLSIVSEIIEHYGGSIAVQSTEQKTCFSGSIPKQTPLPVQDN